MLWNDGLFCLHFGFHSRCGVAGGEKVAPAPLGRYFKLCYPLLTIVYTC